MRYKLVVKNADGEVVGVREKDNDMFTANFGAWLAAIFKLGFTKDSATTYTAIDENGTARTLGNYSSNSDYVNRASPIHCDWGNQFRVAIGSSTSAPTVNDIALGAEVARVQANMPQVVADPSTGELKIIFSATFSFDQEQTVSEIGVFFYARDKNNNGFNILVARDTFEPVTVSAGGSVTIQYEWVFNPAT
ncbi:hypothetical protein [Archaeoglobus sp. UBA230]|uniref:hypothetical protein n=1 Tax=Archaeoglobus sp. UBA230 TaxID=1915565 RepID=UPI0025BDC3F9|nr:hypothetical protein [Archaeoglobus sp. UBA230]